MEEFGPRRDTGKYRGAHSYQVHLARGCMEVERQDCYRHRLSVPYDFATIGPRSGAPNGVELPAKQI